MRRKTVEEYVETIFVLEKKEGAAHTGKIAEVMGVKPPSVTEMLQKLQESGFVKYKPFIGANLTSSGKNKARKLMDRHRVIADFIEILGVDRELAEIDACQLEHHVSETTMQRLEKFVEFVRDSPQDPRWMEHFKHYLKTGVKIGCGSCMEENKFDP
ncbi:MAG: metal-dependent transcriptional regulator [Candidatus Thermoplasmatota archaeon]|jgi:DtxR family Mn-dependent transcriptional regulator|nr:metal-dependent transcriptional regulator [Candidatus Thermoplasmatota archaeon]